MKTFVIGCSHVTRLRKFIEKGNDWNLGDHVVKIQGVNGGAVSSMFRRLVDIKEFQPNVVFLQIGSNDIGNSNVTVKDVLMSIEILVDVGSEMRYA
jgi:lysophospholipase L1-like esterase